MANTEALGSGRIFGVDRDKARRDLLNILLAFYWMSMATVGLIWKTAHLRLGRLPIFGTSRWLE
jgi:hypothetical protein